MRILKAIEGLNIINYESHDIESLDIINEKLYELYENFRNTDDEKKEILTNYVFYINGQKKDQEIKYVQKIDTKVKGNPFPHYYHLQFAISESKGIAFPDGQKGILFTKDKVIEKIDKREDLINSMKDEKILIACYSLFGADNNDVDYKY